VWKYLIENSQLLRDGATLLHLAPEPFLVEALRRSFRLRHVAADLASPHAGSHHDLTRLGFRSGSFDAALSLHVLEHVADDAAALAELRRVLRCGGWALIHVPLRPGGRATDEDPTVTDPRARLRRWGQEDHVRLYGLDLAARLDAAGFAVRLERCSHLWGREEIVRAALLPGRSEDDVLFFATAR